MGKKNVVINKRGAKVRMNEAALKIAEKHFGVNRARAITKEVPPELLNLPSKIEIIKAKPIPEPVAKAPVIEIQKNEETEEVVKKATRKRVRK